MPGDFFGAAWRRTAVLNQKMADITYINLHFVFALARAKTFSDVLTLQADYWQKLFAALGGEQLRFKAAEPQPTVNQEENVEKAFVPSEPKRKDKAARSWTLQRKDLNKGRSKVPEHARAKPRKLDPS